MSNSNYEDSKKLAINKMQDAQISDSAINQFMYYFDILAKKDSEEDNSNFLRESEIVPVNEIPSVNDFKNSDDTDVLSKVAMLKLNGGLGTSMGLSGPKSLLTIKNNLTFLDIIIKQLESTNEMYKSNIPLILMNSLHTDKQTKSYINDHNTNLNIDYIFQEDEPKLDAKTLEPASYPENPELEFCPPGHGSVFITLYSSGILDKLESSGIKYIFISNSDNLGATISPEILAYFENNNFDFLMELARKTPADVKGGHIVKYKNTTNLTIRESAQVHPDDEKFAQDIDLHPYFNTNNLYIKIDALKKIINEYNGILPLPMIENLKTVNPSDENSQKVIQIETAMGSAIAITQNSGLLHVNRDRLVPVKSTNDLLLLRSDLYEFDDLYNLVATIDSKKFPLIKLDKKYKLINDFENLIPKEIPSFKNISSDEINKIFQ
ncbi:MAG: UTP--glucose-1-phosphate uridylyltransferase [Bifidobacteriaceae bacterium]|jgi:UTP--glucose-1-phosphate uridylyltransferase|nr:UTP--glucose-1-phosphate uridylyltransferase [Bifidobacteriaceae bacterium]